MAAIFKVKLEDDYTAKAKKIASSTEQMESAMSKVGSVAKKTRSALKSALDRKYKVDIKETGSKYLESRVSGLKKNLDTLNKPYEVKITAKMSRLDKVKSNLSEIKENTIGTNSILKKTFNATKQFKIDYSTFRQAKKEAKQLSEEITSFTGKTHKVHIDMESPVKSLMSKMKSGLSSGMSKFNPKNWFGGGRGSSPAAATGGGGNLVGSIVKGNLITGAIGKGVEVLKSGIDTTLGAGLNRLENIQSSKAKLKGFGYDKGTVESISKIAMKSVKGTAYGFGDAMTASANAVAAGIKPGKELESHLSNIANAAAATGSDFNEIGSIFNKVKTTGHLQGDEAMQIMDRGISLLPALAKTMNTSVDEVQKKMSKGEISFEQFSEAMHSATGNVSKEMNNTFGAAKDNLKAALGRIGAGLLGGSDNNGGLFAGLTPMIQGVIAALGPFESAAGKVGDKLGELATGAIDKVKSGLSYLGDKFKPLGDKLSQMIEPLKSVFGSLKESFGQIFNLGGDAGGSLLDSTINIIVSALTSLADITQSYVIPAMQTVADFISANVVPAIQTVVTWIQANVAPALQTLGTIIIGVAVPALQAIGGFINTIVLPALSAIGSFIMGSVIPALTAIASVVLSVAVPAFQIIASIISGVVTAAFNAITAVVNGAVGVFHALTGAVHAVKSAFESVVGAVHNAASALSGLPGKISGAVSNAVGSIKSKITGHATGTSYFGGGMTRVNERGEEMIQLARGDKIYPSGKTDRIIEKQINNRNQNRETKNITLSPTININGANKNGEEIAKEVNRQLRRLAVNI